MQDIVRSIDAGTLMGDFEKLPGFRLMFLFRAVGRFEMLFEFSILP
jgi:hypothetical protein